jgi:hypothetical protein
MRCRFFISFLFASSFIPAGTACSSSSSAPVASDAGALDAATPPSADPSYAYDGGIPPIEGGLLTAIQGAPAPQPGEPAVFFFVGCPMGGAVTVVPFTLDDQGVATAFGPFQGTYAYSGTHDAITVSADGASLVDIAYDETGSISVAPYEYKATVTISPKLLTTPDTFIARMLNPSQPSLDDVGSWVPYTLAACAR